MKVRQAKASDTDAIVAFQMKMAKETENLNLDKVIVKKGVEAVFRYPEKGKYFIAEDENPVASLMLTPEWSDWRNATVYWLQSVYVLPEYRKKHVFSKMFRYVFERIEKDPDSAGLRLYVDKSNQKAIKVYEKLGMDGDHYRLFELMKKTPV
ncbi:MAG: GNAT family N-acetyltransferase [Bacteroidota bacterium]